MKKSILLFITIASFLCIIPCRAYDVITFFFKQYPLDQDQAMIQKTCAQLKNPAHTNTYCINTLLDHAPITGIISTYAGFMNTSDLNGQVVYPRRHKEEKLYFLITPTITPVFMTQNTIHHWEINSGVPAELYSATKIQEKETGEYYWDIRKMPLPDDKVVPLESILIFAKPDNIVIQTGLIAAPKTHNLILPDIYVKKGINLLSSALYILNLRHFFGRTKYQIQFHPDKSYTKLFVR